MRLTALYLHPVKSTRAIRVDSAEVTRIGLKYDRQWMIVDAEGSFVFQRTMPILTNLETLIHSSELELRLRESPSGKGGVFIPLEPDTTLATRMVNIWGDSVEARSCGEAADAWLASILGPGYALVTLSHSDARPLESRGHEKAFVSFADGYPYLVANEASLEDLEQRAGVDLTMERFRPNLVFEGGEPWAEDDATSMTVGDVMFDLVKPCVRCVVTTLDPETGASGKEPLATLATYRRDASGGVTFGVNAIARNSGTLRVGDPVRFG